MNFARKRIRSFLNSSGSGSGSYKCILLLDTIFAVVKSVGGLSFSLIGREVVSVVGVGAII